MSGMALVPCWLGLGVVVLIISTTPTPAQGLTTSGRHDNGTVEGTAPDQGESSEPTRGLPDPPGPPPARLEITQTPSTTPKLTTQSVTSASTSTTHPTTEEIIMTTDTTTREPDACESAPCLNDGQCTPEGSTYKCFCQRHNGVLYGGYRCETKVAYDPVVSALEPDFGPEAGKTTLTIHGSSLILPLDGVYLGQGAARHRCHVVKRTGLNIVLHTPPLSTDTNSTQPVSLEFAGGLTLPRPGQLLIFEYKPDPIIEFIHPLETLSRGGTLLTIHGQYLDSVYKPEVKVIVVYHNNSTQKTRSREPPVTRLIFYQVCILANRTSSLLLCRVPHLKIPENYLDPDLAPTQDEDDEILNFGPRAREPETTTAEPISTTAGGTEPPPKPKRVLGDKLNVATETSKLEFHLGFVLDGVTSYLDLSQHDSLNEVGSLDVYKPPTILNCSTELVYQPDMWLTIQGWHLLRGASATDYNVEVGPGICEVSYINDTALRCRLPGDMHTSMGSQTHDIVVHIGLNYEIVYGQIVYKSTSKLPLIIGIVCGCLGILVCLVVVLIIFRLLRRRRRGKSYRYGPVSHTLPPPVQMDSSNPPPPIQMVNIPDRGGGQGDLANGKQTSPSLEPVRYSNAPNPSPKIPSDAGNKPRNGQESQNPQTNVYGNKASPSDVYTAPKRRPETDKNPGKKRYANMPTDSTDGSSMKPSKRKAKTLPNSYRNMPLPGLPIDPQPSEERRPWRKSRSTSHSDDEDDIYMNSPIKPRGLARVSGGRRGGHRHRFDGAL